MQTNALMPRAWLLEQAMTLSAFRCLL